MRKWKLAASATAASGIVAVGIFAAFTLNAKAATANLTGCSVPGTGTETTAITCTATNTIPYPETITLTAATSTAADLNGSADLPVTFAWNSTCTQQSGTPTDKGTTTENPSGDSPPTLTLTPASMDTLDPISCALTVTVTVAGKDADTATALNLTGSATESAAASASATPTPTAPASSTASTPPPPPPSVTRYNNQVHGFDGICLDDKGNKSADRTAVIIWGCNNTDQAQGWAYSGSELKIHGMCLNAKGSGKTGSKLILWTCNGGGNEIFSHRSNGEFAEKANGYTMCIDDPGYSTKNGTLPFMYKCNDGANQRWSKP